ncbi:hypothetical protein B0H14DRAFT_3676616 [Mycena olivaceomarginata]|nr:hypothetical protein B0H14DRAFT_3676616 [Mycena olivaceomarginata]
MASSGKSFDKSCTNPAAPCSGRGLPPSFDFLMAERDRLVEEVGDCKLLFPAPFTPVQHAHLAQYLDILRTVAPDLERYAAAFEPIEFDESIFPKPVMPEIPLKLFLTEEERVARLDSYRPELDNWRAASLKRVDAQLAHAYREHERREEHHATEATKLLEWSLRVFKALKRVPEFANLLNTSDETLKRTMKDGGQQRQCIKVAFSFGVGACWRALELQSRKFDRACVNTYYSEGVGGKVAHPRPSTSGRHFSRLLLAISAEAGDDKEQLFRSQNKTVGLGGSFVAAECTEGMKRRGKKEGGGGGSLESRVGPVGGYIPDLDKHIMGCSPRAGASYVERRDYSIVSEDGSFIMPVEFAQTVKAGMLLERSILQWQARNRSDTIQKTTCPGCGCSQATTSGNGWLKWCIALLFLRTGCGRNYRMGGEDQNLEEIVSQQLVELEEEAERELFRRVHILVTTRVSFLVH